MKKIFTLIAAALMSASMFAQPATVPTVSDLTGAGYDLTNRVICLYFDEQVCNDIVWAGSYNEWAIDNPASMLHFEALAGFEGWYVVEVEDASDPCQGKPVQLKKDGSFSWDFQSGDVEAWINMAQPRTQTVSFEAGDSGEANCTWPTTGAYIYEVAYFKNHNTPCGAPDDPVLATLDSLVIKGKATKMEYEVGEAFDPAGLEVWGIYTKTVKHDSISQVKSGITWTLDPETFEEASDNASVTMVASYKELTTADTTITGINVKAAVPIAETFDLTIVQDVKWSDDGAKIAAWIWGDDLNGQWTGWATNLDDILTLKVDERADSIIFIRNASDVTDPSWDALNRIDAGEIQGCHLFFITEENNGAWCHRPVVETKIYAKNNWNNGEWTWKEMTKSDENVYTLDRVVFGGTGVNINSKEDDTDALWFSLEGMSYVNGTIQAMDTVRFEFSQKDSVLTATLLGRPASQYKYTTYENWQIKHEGSEWTWTENLVKVEDGLFKLADANWTGSGFNVKSDDNPIKKDWFDPVYGDPNDFHIAEGVNPPKTVDVYLRVIDDETLKIGIGEAPPIQFVDTASGLKFEVTSMEEPRTVKVINNEYPGTSCTVPGTVTYCGETFDVTEIGVEAFHDCSSLESITLPESVTTLANASLATSGLKSITIPATVTTIGEYAFAECLDLKSVTFQGNACQEGIADNAFEGVGTTTTPATLTLPDDWAGSTPENSETPWYGGYFDYTAPGPRVGGKFVDETSGLKFEITSYEETSKTVKVIADSYTGASYDIPETVTNWEKTFEVTEIDAYAFAECPLETFTVPASIVKIGAGAFSNCTSLQSVTFKGNACQNDINVTAFYGVGEDTPATLTLPDNWTGAKPESSILEWFGGFCAIRE